MTIIKAEDMHCEKCVERITKAMKEADLEFKVDLERKEIAVDGGEEYIKAAIDILDDLGFDGIVQ